MHTRQVQATPWDPQEGPARLGFEFRASIAPCQPLGTDRKLGCVFSPSSRNVNHQQAYIGSTLAEYWQYAERPDFFAAMNEPDDELERFAAVLRWTFTKDLKFVKHKIAKPYNSILFVYVYLYIAYAL
jgi:hypothetical protein